MLISRVPDETGGEGRGEPEAAQVAHDFQTASELFDLMTKDHDFEAGDDSLTTRDLVLLYKNIDLGKQLMTNVNQFKRQTPNQYVENVIYHDEGETDSDISESYSNEDINNIMLVNKERINLLTSNQQPSFNSLCHKLGDLEIQVSNISTDYDRQFLFNDPHIKEQLKSLQLKAIASELDIALLPTSLLDYICCKRLEDNYSFYMDNIIRYVKHTIDQLKRISNGDYLTDKVKEKWREVQQEKSDNESKVLTTSISIPLEVKQKVTGCMTAWDDIVHSEIDLRSLVKILEKKIVLEVPRMICGSYEFFRKYQADNLIISCKCNTQAAAEKVESRVDVVFQLQRSEAGQVISNIDSIMILQPKQQIVEEDCKKMLPLTCKQVNNNVESLSQKVIELDDQDVNNSNALTASAFTGHLSEGHYYSSENSSRKESWSDSNTAPWPDSPPGAAQVLHTVPRVIRTEAAANHATPNELHVSMLNFNRETYLPEGLLDYSKVRKKSPMKVRIKSPYENKSCVMEEKKRRRLLEVRERREKRKMAADDANNKVVKHKAFPQATSSVTKLSITNKAFYNSIYGRTVNDEDGKRTTATTVVDKKKGRKGMQKRDGVIQEIGQELEEDSVDGDDGMLCRNLIKINESHFLDDAETEMSYLQKTDKDFLRISTSTSAVSNESGTKSDYCASFTSLNVGGHGPGKTLQKRRSEHDIEAPKTRFLLEKPPDNSFKDEQPSVPAVECRRSIEKIFTLMKKLQEIETNDTTSKKKTANEPRGLLSSESGTRVSHGRLFTNPSYSSIDSPAFSGELSESNKQGDENDRSSSVIHKVVICTKPPPGLKTDETRKERKAKINNPRARIPENPFKAISKLLHEFDYVQKSRQKATDPKSINRFTVSDARNVARQDLPRKRTRVKSPWKEEPVNTATAKAKSRSAQDDAKTNASKTQILDKNKINDLIDEVKEARGEAVRGPTKFSSRLNMLAQPKRAYVQALNEEFSRRQTTERVPRPASHAPRLRCRASEGHSSISVKPPNSALERTTRPHYSATSSPETRQRDPPQAAPAPAATATAAATTNIPRPSLKKKMVALDSHAYSRGPKREECARAPVLPNDLESISKKLLSSPASQSPPPLPLSQQSTNMGIRLHRLVASMTKPERPASQNRVSAPVNFDHNRLAIIEQPNYPNEPIVDKKLEENHSFWTPCNSDSELEQLKEMLQRHVSSGSFSGRLRFKKLTLTPKPSLQQAMMHHSGDTTSILFQSGLPQTIRVSPDLMNRKTDLMAVLSNARLDRGFFPLQIANVGCTFSTCQGKMKNIPKRMSNHLLVSSEEGAPFLVNENRFPVTTMLAIKDSKKKVTPCHFCQHVMTKPAEAECGVQVGAYHGILHAHSCPTVTSMVTEQIDAPRKNKSVETNTSEERIVLDSDILYERDDAIKTCESEGKHEMLEYTTSLDILVGLLNEITKLTISDDDGATSQTPCKRSATPDPGANFEERSTHEPHRCLSLFAANGKCRADGSEIFTPTTRFGNAEGLEYKPLCQDKEVLALEPCAQPADAAAAPRPLHLSPNDAGTSTSTIIVSTSSCSTSAIVPSEYCNTSIESDDRIVEQAEANPTNSVKSLVPFYDNMCKATNNKTAVDLIQYVSAVPARKSKKDSNKLSKVLVQNSKGDVNISLNTAANIDDTLKIKRDVLVTFYSILVLTVFAALAFPEIMQQA